MRKTHTVRALLLYWLLSISAEAQSSGKQTVCSMAGSQMVCREVAQPTGYIGDDQWCRLSPTGILGRLAMCVYKAQVECERNIVTRSDACLVNPEFKPVESTPPPVGRVEQPPILLSCEMQRVADERLGAQRSLEIESYVISDQGAGSISVERKGGSNYAGTINETTISFSRRLTGKDLERMEISRLSGKAEKALIIGSEKTRFEGDCKRLERRF